MKRVELPNGAFVSVQKQYEVYCYDCGVVDSLVKRDEAMKLLRAHVAEHKREESEGGRRVSDKVKTARRCTCRAGCIRPVDGERGLGELCIQCAEDARIDPERDCQAHEREASK